MRAYYSPRFRSFVEAARLPWALAGEVIELLRNLPLYEMLRALEVIGPDKLKEYYDYFAANPGKDNAVVLAACEVVLSKHKKHGQKPVDLSKTGDESTARTFLKWYDDGSFVPERRAIIEKAEYEYTTCGDARVVEAKKDGSEKDQNGKTLRKGWSKLIEYFQTAYGQGEGPGLWSSAEIKYRRPGYTITVNGVEASTVDGMPHWCGIFASWAIRTSGLKIQNWATGMGVTRTLKSVNMSPKVGDVGYLDRPFNHHFLVYEVSEDGKSVQSIDGNSGGTSTITRTLSFKAKETKANGYYTAFFKGGPNGLGY